MAEVDVKVAFQDLTRLEDLIKNAGLKAPNVIAKAIDAVGNKTMTQVKRSVAAQAGVPVGKAGAVLSKRQAMGAGGGSFSIVARDVMLSLKEFGPRKTVKGISAAPWHKRRLPAHLLRPGWPCLRARGQGKAADQEVVWSQHPQGDGEGPNRTALLRVHGLGSAGRAREVAVQGARLKALGAGLYGTAHGRLSSQPTLFFTRPFSCSIS